MWIKDVNLMALRSVYFQFITQLRNAPVHVFKWKTQKSCLNLRIILLTNQARKG